MKRPAVFFDRDNTLIANDGYLGDPAKVVLVGGAAAAVARARELGYAVVVFSNQSGVARGMFSEEDVAAVNARTDELLAAENAAAIVDRHEFCPFHPDGTIDVYARESDRRKPRPGMILAAADKLALELSRSWVIGDAPRDVEAGKAAGCRTILFNDPALARSSATEVKSAAEPDYVVTTLAEAMEFIERNQEMKDEGGRMTDETEGRKGARALPALAPSVAHVPAVAKEPAPVKAVEAPPADVPTSAGTPPAPAAAAAAAPAPAPRVPKVVIGSKYVPPAGKDAPAREAARDASKPAPREVPVAEPAPRKAVATPREVPVADSAPLNGFERMESMLEQIFLELRREHEHDQNEFSVSKLLAGVVQVLVLAALFFAYLRRDNPAGPLNYLMVALVLQTMTVSLLIMSRQK